MKKDNLIYHRRIHQRLFYTTQFLRIAFLLVLALILVAQWAGDFAFNSTILSVAYVFALLVFLVYSIVANRAVARYFAFMDEYQDSYDFSGLQNQIVRLTPSRIRVRLLGDKHNLLELERSEVRGVQLSLKYRSAMLLFQSFIRMYRLQIYTTDSMRYSIYILLSPKQYRIMEDVLYHYNVDPKTDDGATD